MRYTAAQREQMKEMLKGKRIERLEYDEEGEYWTIVLSDESEFSFRFMAELN